VYSRGGANDAVETRTSLFVPNTSEVLTI
jgi:hypothetical protein